MTLLGDQVGRFDDCHSVTEANALYKELFDEFLDAGKIDLPLYTELSDAHRRCSERLTTDREQVVPNHVDNDDRVRPRVLRNWALRQGIPLAKKGRVPATVENAYRKATGLPLLVLDCSPRVSLADDGVDATTVRNWARETGIEVGSRGRVHSDLIAQYVEAHS